MNKFPNPIYLTHPNIPKPLHGVNPRSVKGKEWWNIKRQKAYAVHNYHCWACGILKWNAKYYQWLEGHEEYQINYETGEVKLKGIIALCHSCHNFIHSGRLFMLYQEGKWSKEKSIKVLRHGFSILKKAGLDPFEGTKHVWFAITGTPNTLEPQKEIKIAAWEKWHLIIEGEKYYSKFKNIDELKRHYGN